MKKSHGARGLVAALLIALSLTAGSTNVGVAEGSVEQRVAEFWKRVDALQPGDFLSAADLGQWALNVMERSPRARIIVTDFRSSTSAMQSGTERAGLAPVAATAAPTPATGNVEQRVADFSRRVDALQPGDFLSAADLGQWALNVMERSPRARIIVTDFRSSTSAMQSGMERAGLAPVAATPAPPPRASTPSPPAPTPNPTTTTIGGLTFRVHATTTSAVYSQSTVTTADAQTIIALVDTSVAHIEREFGRRFAERPSIYAFDTEADFSLGWTSVLGVAGPSLPLRGVFITNTKKIGLNWGGMKLTLPRNTVRHELVHQMVFQIIQNDRSTPTWFHEGIARLNDLSEPGGEYRVTEVRYGVASMAHTGTLFATRSNDFGAEANAAYAEGAETVRLMRADLAPAGLLRFLELIGQGTSFRDAYQVVAGRSLDAFLAGRDQQLRALATTYPGIATADDTQVGAGMYILAYGFAPSSSVTLAIKADGRQLSVQTVQANAYGTYGTYLPSAWPSGGYTITAVGGGSTATVIAVKVASAADLSSLSATKWGELPELVPMPAMLPE